MTQDPTENVRREMVQDLNRDPGDRESLEVQHGQVWNTQEVSQDFEIEAFMAPFCVATRRSDGVRGSLMFQDRPRFYFHFQPA